MSKTIKWIVIILLILALAAVVFFIIREVNKPTQQGQGPPTSDSGFLGGFGSIISGVGGWIQTLFLKGCDPNRPGFQKDGTYNPSKCSTKNNGWGGNYPVVDCDPNRPGYEKDGTYNPNCGKDYTGCQSGVCDPARPGYDKCGFPDINCGFGG